MRLAVLALICLSAGVFAWPKVACNSYTCANGWTTKTNVDPASIACLAEVCTDRVCCNPPTCASLTNPTCILKPNPKAIQCPGNTLAGCTAHVCCANDQTTAAPTAAPSVSPCVDYSVYFANFKDTGRVNKMRLNFDSASGTVSLVPNSIALVSNTNGGDGITLNPQNNAQLFVGGQEPRLFIVDTTNPNPDTNWWRQKTDGLAAGGGVDVFHVSVIDNGHVVGTNINNESRISYHTLVNGTLLDQVEAPILNVVPGTWVPSSVFPIGDGRLIYTTSGENGNPGFVGFITLQPDQLTATTAAPFISNVAAHSGVYHQATNTLLVWGAQTVSQYTLDGQLLSTLDVTTLIGTANELGFRHVDNGVIASNRWLLLAANSGSLLWFDLGPTGRIATALAGSFVVTTDSALDAITMPVCNSL